MNLRPRGVIAVQLVQLLCVHKAGAVSFGEKGSFIAAGPHREVRRQGRIQRSSYDLSKLLKVPSAGDGGLSRGPPAEGHTL